MAKLIALLLLVIAAVAVSGQYLASPYARGYLGGPLVARGAYAAPFGVGYPGYLGYGARGVVLG